MLTNMSELSYLDRMASDAESRENDEWWTWTPPEGADGLHVHWRRDDSGRWVADGLYLHGRALTPGMLRAVSLPRLESRRNGRLPGTQKPAVSDETRTVGSLRQRATDLARSEMRVDAQIASNREALELPPRLGRPDGSDPEAFYRRVAEAYSHYAEQTKAPAKAIADEAEVPVTTVHRWIREARQRGFLPQGRRGKAG